MLADRDASLDPRLLLQQELARRCEKNPRYSLRAFARSLGLSHTVLSLVLSGKRPPSRGVLVKVSEFADLTDEQRAEMLSRWGRKKTVAAGPKQPDSQLLPLDVAAVISEWHYFAILSLLEVRGARWDARWIGRRLGISEQTAQQSMDRLKRLKLVVRQGARWRQSGLPIKVENSVSTTFSRKFQRQVLEKAIESLENDSMDQRHLSSSTLAMDPSQIPYAKEKIRQFRRQLARELEKRGPRTRVYNFAVQLYPVSTPDRSEKDDLAYENVMRRELHSAPEGGRK